MPPQPPFWTRLWQQIFTVSEIIWLQTLTLFLGDCGLRLGSALFATKERLLQEHEIQMHKHTRAGKMHANPIASIRFRIRLTTGGQQRGIQRSRRVRSSRAADLSIPHRQHPHLTETGRTFCIYSMTASRSAQTQVSFTSLRQMEDKSTALGCPT